MKIFVLALAGMISLLAHDSYLMPAKFVVEPGKPLLVSIHNGDSFPASEHPTDPRRIAKIQLSDGSAVTDLQTTGRATHGFIKITRTGSHYLHAALHPRPLEMPAAKFEAYLREEGLDHIIAARKQSGQTASAGREVYTKYAKAYLVCGAPDQAFSAVLGHTIEVVPEVDPVSLSKGGVLPVRVLFRGKPLPNAQVQNAWATAANGAHAIVGRTDADGRISVPIHAEGKWRLHVIHMEASKDSAVGDWQSFWASFTFEVPSAISARR